MAKPKMSLNGILGGTFDPAHKGHLKISEIEIRKINLKKIYWVITKKNPFKKKPYYSLKARFKKAKEIIKGKRNIKLLYLDDIIKSSRSIKIIEYMIKKKKIKNLYFIIGSDILCEFHKWNNWKKIVKLTKLVVFSRKGYDKKAKESVVSKYLCKNNIIFVKNKPIKISSTFLRKNIRKNNSCKFQK